MVKYITLMVISYLVYKVIKNGAYVALEQYKQKDELDIQSDLVKCSQCDHYVSEEISVTQKNRIFCSEECAEAYHQSN